MPRVLLNNLYITDEDIFVEAGADFGVLVPKSNKMASGTDGVFLAGDLWTLNSASNAFATHGVLPGMVIQLTAPKTTYISPEYLAIDSVAANAVTLRRCGVTLTGLGMPPGPVGGLTGITFQVLTLNPQIESAAFYLDQQFDVDEATPYRSPGNIYNQEVFRRILVLRVVSLLYMAENRSDQGDFARKVMEYKSQFAEEYAKTSVRWGPQGVTQPSSGPGVMRISR